MKTCPRCGEPKALEEFGKNSSRSDGLQVYCKPCLREYRKDHYHSNKEQYYRRNTESHGRMRDHVLSIKEGNCVDCGESYPGEPWLMEFDHRDPTEKVATVHQLVQGGSWALLLAEIKKCDLLCVICHRRRTAKRGGWQQNRYAGAAGR